MRFLSSGGRLSRDLVEEVAPGASVLAGVVAVGASVLAGVVAIIGLTSVGVIGNGAF